MLQELSDIIKQLESWKTEVRARAEQLMQLHRDALGFANTLEGLETKLKAILERPRSTD